MSDAVTPPDLAVVFPVFRRRLVLISAIAIALVALAGAITRKLPRLYRAEALMKVEAVATEQAALGPVIPSMMTQAQRGEQRQRVAAAASMMTTPPVIDSVIIKLQLKGPKGGPRQSLRSGGPYAPLVPFPDMSVKCEAIRGTGLVRVRGFARTPEQAQILANGLVDCYLNEKEGVQRRRLHTTLNFLDAQTADMNEVLARRRRALQSYQEEHGTVDPQRETQAAIQRFMQLRETEQQCLLDLRTAESSLQPLYQQLRSVLSTQMLDQLNSPAGIAGLQERLEQLEATRSDPLQSEASRRQTELDIETVQEQLREAILPSSNIPEHVTQSASRSLLSRYLDARVQVITLTAQRGAISGLLAEQQQELRAIPEQVSSILPLQVNSEAAAETYRTALQQRGSIVVGAAVQASEVRLLTPAKLPTRVLYPWTLVNLAVGLFLGLFLGIGVALVVEYNDDKIRDAEALEGAVGAPLLASVPRIPVKRWFAFRRKRPSLLRSDPQSPLDRAYRSMRNRLWVGRESGGCRTAAFLSPRPKEGRTSSSIGLARSLAHESSRVLLVDLDLHRPGVHRKLGMADVPGLTDVLYRGAKLDDAVRSTEVPGLSVLPAGTTAKDVGAVFKSPGFRTLMTTLRERFDYIIFDTPAVLVLNDVVALTEWVDDTLVVARAGKSRHRDMKDLNRTFRAAGLNPGHTVFVGVSRR